VWEIAVPVAPAVALKYAVLIAAVASVATTSDVDSFVVALDDAAAAVAGWDNPAVAAA